jgi:hypothetical protein
VKTTSLFDSWKGMAPDTARDKMARDTVWLMRDYLPDVLGSQLESRSPWTYYVNGPLNGPVRAQKWVSTLGLNHHLAVTAATLYNLDVPGSPRVVQTLAGSGGDAPMASLYEFVGVPLGTANLPLFVQYTPGSGVETILTTHASTPKCKFMEAWNAQFVLGNVAGEPQRVVWLEPGFSLTGTTTPAYDVKAWWDTSNDVTALARSRTAIIVFHANGVERLRGGISPGTNRQTDLWLEPLKGLGGCTQPNSVCYWNDNVLFCDGRSVYITDGTQITDLGEQGKAGRIWRSDYASGVRISGGIYANYYVLSVINGTTGVLVRTWVINLISRKWLQVTNVACSSLVTAVDTNEHLYGGTWNGKVIDISRMWDEADPTTDTVDANGVAVLPQLETAWYGMSRNYARQRVREMQIAYELNEDSGQVNLYVCKQKQPQASDWQLLKSLRMRDQDGFAPDTRGLVRRSIQMGLEGYGFTFKIETTGTLKNLKLADLDVEGPILREESYA